MKRVVFFGTPDIATPFLKALHNEGAFEVVAVVTQPDKPVGRKQVLTPSPIAQFAEQESINTFKPVSLKKDPSIVEELEKLQADLFVVFAYGKIIPESILSIPANGCINVHPSKLPVLRGPSPIQTAIRDQFTETAISIMLMDEGMDSGPILAQELIELSSTETTESLSNTIMKVGPELLTKTLLAYLNGSVQPMDQDDDKATFCKMINKEDGQVDPQQQSAKEISAIWRAFSVWPKCRVTINDEWYAISDLKVVDDLEWLKPGELGFQSSTLFLQTTIGALEIGAIQPPGKAMMNAKAFVNGIQMPVEWLKSQKTE